MINLKMASVYATCSTVLFLSNPIAGFSGQSGKPIFDNTAVESATSISDGVCSNTAVGTSYRFLQEMKPHDAARMHELAVEGSEARGIGPEARYILYGYEEAGAMAMLCGASNDRGQVQIMAMPGSAIQTDNKQALDSLVESFGEELNGKSSPAYAMSVNGIGLECSDVRAHIGAADPGKQDIWATFCVNKANSYLVIWSLLGNSEEEHARLLEGLNSIKIFTPQALKSISADDSGMERTPIEPEFQASLREFLKEWLKARDLNKTKAFIDPEAYAAPPLIGDYCSGWYHADSTKQEAEKMITQNLMGVPSDYAPETSPGEIFTAWKRLPPQWLRAASNDVATDHYLIARLDADQLSRIFGGVFASSHYGKFLEKETSKSKNVYWVVFPQMMPDGDVFVVFTLWEKHEEGWKVVNVDVVCQ